MTVEHVSISNPNSDKSLNPEHVGMSTPDHDSSSYPEHDSSSNPGHVVIQSWARQEPNLQHDRSWKATSSKILSKIAALILHEHDRRTATKLLSMTAAKIQRMTAAKTLEQEAALILNEISALIQYILSKTAALIFIIILSKRTALILIMTAAIDPQQGPL
jgi:hypothetical protein